MIENYHNQLRIIANYDSLTDLPNRQFFLQLLNGEIENAKQQHTKIAVMFLDLDKFKNINDQYGHAVGDKLLQLSTKRIKKVIRTNDVLGRQSGDEFILYLSHVPNQEFVNLTAKRIIDSCASPFLIGNLVINTTFSIGVAMYPDDGEEADQLIINADKSMYRIKAQSGNNFMLYDDKIEKIT